MSCEGRVCCLSSVSSPLTSPSLSLGHLGAPLKPTCVEFTHTAIYMTSRP